MIDLDLYSKLPFLEHDLIEAIRDKGILKKFHPGDELIREGQFISSFPIVLSGVIKVIRRNEEGDELLLYYLKEKEICSMSITCCLSQAKSNIRALVEQETTAIMLENMWLEKWLCEFPTWKQYIMRSIHWRFQELLEVVDSIAFLKMDERLEKFFIDRFEKTGKKTFSGSHQELAYQLNTSREVISRILKKFEKQGLLKLSRNYIDFSGLL
ncbi:MAG: Crp/Fnr family transcriptional regulator [Prolixibacteraceae bacterium]|nr:Crp/Fnr family transcriptional regulator [Prolixibacteraceae bacterium]MBN2773961.1 Crp/Fnr family transcriptional regulator [Prolixibacteraceae bacterium]